MNRTKYKHFQAIFNLIFILFVPFNSWGSEAIIRISKPDKSFKILKTSNGGFIEYIADFVDGKNGILAQEIQNRGFDFSLNGLELGEFWNKYNSNTQTTYSLVEGGYNQNGRYYQRILNNSNENVGISQNIYLSDTVAHDCYVYVKSKTTSIISVKIFTTEFSKELYSKTFLVDSINWSKIAFSIPKLLLAKNNVQFVIQINGKGELEIDEASIVPRNSKYNMRSEYIELIKALKPGILRYPGGCFADMPNTKLQNMIGQIDQRLSPNDINHIIQRMDWGLDEFLQFCTDNNIEPYITLNMQNGSPEEAANFVEYCNGTIHTEMGKVRASNGHKNPYNVKYFELGNEQWEDVNLTITKHLAMYNKIIEKDSNVIIIADGNHWKGSEYLSQFVNITNDKTGLYGWHPTFFVNTNKGFKDSDIYSTAIGYGIDSYLAGKHFQNLLNIHNIQTKQCISEWWSSYGSMSDWVLDTNSRNHSLEAALWNADHQMVITENPDIFALGARTYALGFIQRGMNSQLKRTIYGVPAYHALAMLQNLSGAILLKSEIISEIFQPSEIEGLQVNYGGNYIRTMSSMDASSIYIAVINKHPEKDISTLICNDMFDFDSTMEVWSLFSADYLDANTFDDPFKIVPVYNKIRFESTYTFPKHSFSILKIKYKEKEVPPPPDTTVFITNIYPNPGSNWTKINLNYKVTDAKIELFDSFGRLVKQLYYAEEKNSITLDIQELAQGVYFGRLISNGKSYSFKFEKTQ